MKKSKLTESQIVKMLQEGEYGIAVTELCWKYKIASSTYYKLKSKYSGMGLQEVHRLRELERENSKLKQMYAELSLEHKIIKEVMEKKYPGLIEKS